MMDRETYFMELSAVSAADAYQLVACWLWADAAAIVTTVVHFHQRLWLLFCCVPDNL